MYFYSVNLNFKMLLQSFRGSAQESCLRESFLVSLGKAQQLPESPPCIMKLLISCVKELSSTYI